MTILLCSPYVTLCIYALQVLCGALYVACVAGSTPGFVDFNLCLMHLCKYIALCWTPKIEGHC